jgi:hypothetical protein
VTNLLTPYPRYDVLSKWDSPSWDDLTRKVIRRRLEEIPHRRFFSETEWHTLEAACSRLLPQPDRQNAIAIVPWIDERLYLNLGDGFRYASMPPMRDAWRLGLAGIDEASLSGFGEPFTRLSSDRQDAVLGTIQRGEVAGGVWQRLPPALFFASTLLRTVVAEYYAHPAAWSEVGFGGPASPRGYVRLGAGQADPWEAERSSSTRE